MKNKIDNVIEMPIKPKLSDLDIANLFFGLCKMVKRLAREEANFEMQKHLIIIEQNYKRQIKNLENINKGLLDELHKKTEAETPVAN